MTPSPYLRITTAFLAVALQLSFALPYAGAQGPGPMAPPPPSMHAAPISIHHFSKTKAKTKSKSKSTFISIKGHHRYPGSVAIKSRRKAKRPAPLPPPPQSVVGSLSQHTLQPGVVHKVHHGAMTVNLLDVDLARANVTVKPVLAGSKFNVLDEVKDEAQKVRAIAAVNGNYFKREGVPLGTLIVDGEWVAGPLFDRTSMGITRDGRILVDRVTLHGTLITSNPKQPKIWVNNINQPRRHGCKLVAYTRRWGDVVDIKYAGTLLAVDATGRIIDKATTRLGIPPGGFVLSDSKESPIADLTVGDEVRLSWQVGPSEWSDVVNAVSGGPVLVRDGKVFLDCKDEKFCKNWTGNQIQARTAVAVTADRHLLLATIEGRHSLWDVAKLLKKLGAVDAMNLDGGGSTTMVIGGRTVTRNGNHFERRVAAALAIVPKSQADVAEYIGAAQVRLRGDYGQLSALSRSLKAAQAASSISTASIVSAGKSAGSSDSNQGYEAPVQDELPPARTMGFRLPMCATLMVVSQPALSDVLPSDGLAKHYSILAEPAVVIQSAQPTPPAAKKASGSRYFGWFKHSQSKPSDES